MFDKIFDELFEAFDKLNGKWVGKPGTRYELCKTEVMLSCIAYSIVLSY